MSSHKARIISRLLALLSIYIDREAALEVYSRFIRKEFLQKRWNEKLEPELEDLTWSLWERIRPDMGEAICPGKTNECDECGSENRSICKYLEK